MELHDNGNGSPEDVLAEIFMSGMDFLEEERYDLSMNIYSVTFNEVPDPMTDEDKVLHIHLGSPADEST